MEKYETYFNEICTEDVEDVLMICTTASKRLWDLFKIKVDDPKMIAVIFSKTYETVLKELANLEKEYDNYQITFCDRFVIGYTTDENENDEKEGNFMIKIDHLNVIPTIDDYDPQLSNRERCVQWNTDNIKKQPEELKKIASMTTEALRKLDINALADEIIIPIFVTVYETIIEVMKIRRKEEDKFEFEINFCSCFYITVIEQEDQDNDIINIRSNIHGKLMLKNDAMASGKYDD
jgi:hypothetical protein